MVGLLSFDVKMEGSLAQPPIAGTELPPPPTSSFPLSRQPSDLLGLRRWGLVAGPGALAALPGRIYPHLRNGVTVAQDLDRIEEIAAPAPSLCRGDPRGRGQC